MKTIELISAQGKIALASRGGLAAINRLSKNSGQLGKMAGTVIELMENPTTNMSFTEAINSVISSKFE